jgi:hypothetical protein
MRCESETPIDHMPCEGATVDRLVMTGWSGIAPFGSARNVYYVERPVGLGGSQEVRRLLVLICSALLMVGTIAPVEASQKRLPPGVRSLFLIDTSSSSDLDSLWRDGLRPSIVSKLSQPFGRPTHRAFPKAQAPTDITVSIINARSQTSPVIKIVTADDAEKMWGFVYNVGGDRPTVRRLEALTEDFFGPVGGYTKLAERYLSDSRQRVPTVKECSTAAYAAFSSGQFMSKVSKSKKDEAVKGLCEVTIRIGTALKSADAAVATKCQGACSDVVGALRRAGSLTQDGIAAGSKSEFCIAVASDMVNNSPGLTKTSALNTVQMVKTSRTTAEARMKGEEAARAAGVRFPSGMKLKVVTVGQGASTNAAIPIDRLEYLDAYWLGFWKAAGVSTAAQGRSLSEACRG